MYLFEKAINVTGWFATGSRVICSPAPLTTDEDFVLFTSNLKTLRLQLEALGYTYSNKDVEKYKLDKTDPFYMYNQFDAYRHPDNDHNLIVLSREQDYLRWKVATLVAKELNLTDKKDRIMLFRAIRSGGTLFQGRDEIEL